MTQFSGFAPNYYFGQHNKGLSIYMAPGSISGVPFNGQVVNIPAQSTTTLYVDSLILNPNNLLTSPFDFTNSAWTYQGGASVISNNQTDPFNGSQASLMNLPITFGRIEQDFTASLVSIANVIFTFSLWLRISSTSGPLTIIIANQNGSIGSKILTVSNSWTFFQVTTTMPNNSTSINIQIAGSNNPTQNFYIFRPQVVIGSLYAFATVTSGIIDTGGNIINPNILDDGILSITDIRIR